MAIRKVEEVIKQYLSNCRVSNVNSQMSILFLISLSSKPHGGLLGIRVGGGEGKCEIKNAGGMRRKSSSMDELGLNTAFPGENLVESFTETLYSEMLSSISRMIESRLDIRAFRAHQETERDHTSMSRRFYSSESPSLNPSLCIGTEPDNSA